jgi:hypothetical protein
MHFSLALACLATISGAFAAPSGMPLDARSTTNTTTSLSSEAINGLSDNDLNRLRSMGMMAPGENSYGNNGLIWIGNNGYFRTKFTNYSPTPVILVVWQNGSWVNVKKPLVTYSLASLESVTVSMADHVGFGGFSAVYPETGMIDGQVANTWGEFTTNGINSVINVSKMPNMSGRKMTIMPKATGCRADWLNCVFVCTNGSNRCGNAGEYDLLSCDARMNGGKGFDDHHQPSGGCQMGAGGDVDVVFLG